jgi:hypothetical protein
MELIPNMNKKDDSNKISFQYPVECGPIGVQVIMPRYEHAVHTWQGLSNRICEVLGFTSSFFIKKHTRVPILKGSYQINVQLPPTAIEKALRRNAAGHEVNTMLTKLMDDSLEAIKNDWKMRVMAATFIADGKC